MSVLVQLILQFLLPAFLLVDVYRRKYLARRDWLLDVVLVTLVLLFVFMTSRWDWFSYYLRILLIPLLGLVTYASFRCIDKSVTKEEAPASDRKGIEYGVKGLLILAIIVLNIDAFRGYFAPSGTIDLAYPLRSGVYYVGGGGSSRWVNGHHAFPPQDYALDIVRLNMFGNRASGIAPQELSRYAVFEDKVYSPCSGIISQSVDAYPDQTPPERDVEHLAGNYIVISCKGVEVILAHLNQGSLLVQENEVVQQGQVLAQVGNSGNSSQPHLHIHAERGGEGSREILDGAAVPIRFEGRFLVRNSLFTGR